MTTSEAKAHGYREADEIRGAMQDDIRECAYELLNSLNIDQTATNVDQACIMISALVLFSERNSMTPDAWKSVGYLGNLLVASGKMTRLMSQLWYRAGGDNSLSEKPIDNAMDCLNYLAFFIRMYDAGDERGHQLGESESERTI